MESLTKNKIIFKWFIRDLNIYWIKVFFLNIEITLRCSYKIIPISIEKLGTMIGLKKKIFPYKFSSYSNLNYVGKCPSIEYFNNITEIEYSIYRDKNNFFNFRKISIEYCENDLIILKQVLKNIFNIIEKYDKRVLNTSFSFSSISYKLFKKKFDFFEVCDYNLPLVEYEYIRKSYFGGRTEVFGNPDEGEIIHYFDFSGMYAQCMKNKFVVGNPVFKKKNLNVAEIGLHTVKIYSNFNYPILPSYYNKKLLFLNGEFVGTFTHVELKYFLEKGGQIRDHYSSYVYEKEDYVFKNYVEEFIKIREKGVYYKIFGKVMNNGLYGSFALQEDKEETVIVYSDEELSAYIEATDVKSWKKVNNCIILKIIKNNRSKNFLDKKGKWAKEGKRNLIYASYISSYARIKLYEGFLEILKNGGKLYYCDTDSFFAGFKENYLNKNMGEIKWSKIYDDAVFISPKFYFLKKEKNEESVFKGIASNSYKFDEIKKNFYDNKEKIIFKNQLNFTKKEYVLVQKYLEKKVSINNYDKRIFIKNKKETIPIKI